MENSCIEIVTIVSILDALVPGKGKLLLVLVNIFDYAEFAALLAIAIGLAEVSGSTFADVSPDAWYAGVIGAAAKAGLINGQGNNRFAPTAAISCEEMAVMLKQHNLFITI